MTSVRTRFAPSPTGFIHVGNIRTALFAYLTAKHADGTFILRLEDTDKNREVEGSAEHIKECLRVLGLEWDEGIDKGGRYEPYRQSDRLAIYKQWAQKLIDAGRAYADPYAPEEVQKFREQAQGAKRAFLYRDHRPENPPVWDGTQPLRFKSDPKPYQWHDKVYGDLSTGPEVIDDFILIKSDGYPTYNFAHIVDDAEMQVTHVIRGQEFISSQPNYMNLYEALGIQERNEDLPAVHSDGSSGEDSAFPPVTKQDKNNHMALSGSETDDAVGMNGYKGKYSRPIFATMPHVLNETGNKKLGKRDGAKDVLNYIREGYLPETMLNFIATLGWNDGTEQEIFSHEELVKKFTLERVHRSGARFDESRLLWMNGQWIRTLSLDDLYQRVVQFWPESAGKADESRKREILALVQDRLKTLADLSTLTSYFFEEPPVDLNLIETNKQLKKLGREEQVTLLQAAHNALASSDFDAESIQTILNQLIETTGQKPGTLFSLIRIATTWAPFSPQLNDTLAVLGKNTALARLKNSIDSLA